MSRRSSEYYYSDEEDLDIHIRRSSPHAPLYGEQQRHQSLTHSRPLVPVYYTHGQTALSPQYSSGMHRVSSTHRPHSPQPTPVIINNYNEHDDRNDHYALQVARPPRSRSRSRSSFASSAQDYELEKTRKELEAYKMEAAREQEKERYKTEMEYKRLKEEKRKKEEEARAKHEAEEAIEKFKIEEAQKAAKEKKEKEEREKEVKERMEEQMRKGGMSENQIAIIMKKEGAVAENDRPIYTRMSRRHLSIETLNAYRIDYKFDQDPDYLLIKRLVPEYEQAILWTHTRDIRERRRVIQPAQQVFLIDDGHHHHKHKKSEEKLEFVRKKERRPSPSPLLTFLAGGKPR